MLIVNLSACSFSNMIMEKYKIFRSLLKYDCDNISSFYLNMINIEVACLIFPWTMLWKFYISVDMVIITKFHFHSASSLKLYKVQQWPIMYVGIVSYEHHPVLIIPVLNNGGSYHQSLLVCGYTCTLLNTLPQLNNGCVLYDHVEKPQYKP